MVELAVLPVTETTIREICSKRHLPVELLRVDGQSLMAWAMIEAISSGARRLHVVLPTDRSLIQADFERVFQTEVKPYLDSCSEVSYPPQAFNNYEPELSFSFAKSTFCLSSMMPELVSILHEHAHFFYFSATDFIRNRALRLSVSAELLTLHKLMNGTVVACNLASWDENLSRPSIRSNGAALAPFDVPRGENFAPRLGLLGRAIYETERVCRAVAHYSCENHERKFWKRLYRTGEGFSLHHISQQVFDVSLRSVREELLRDDQYMMPFKNGTMFAPSEAFEINQ